MDRPRPRAWEFGQSDGPVQRHLHCFEPPLLVASAPGCGSRSRRIPCELLDAADHLRTQDPESTSDRQSRTRSRTFPDAGGRAVARLSLATNEVWTKVGVG